MLRRSPGFAIVAVLTLAIGIGANGAIFSVINAVLLHPLPFPEPNRIVLLWETDKNRGIDRGTASIAEYLDWREQNHVFEELSPFRTLFFTVTGSGEPEQVYAGQTSANFFRLLRVKPILGRDFLNDEEQPGHEQVVMLSYGMWQRHYGGDREIVGNNITLDGRPYTVIGVLPRRFTLFGDSYSYELWVPFAFNRGQLNRESHEAIVFGRLRNGTTMNQALAEMRLIQERLKQEYPQFDQKNGLRIITFHDDLMRGLKPPLLILLAAVGFVLLIACANIANLLLARAAAREREIAVRVTLGAKRHRVLQQLLTESMLLALIGGIFGVLLTYVGVPLLHAALPPAGSSGEIPHSEWIGIDGAVLGFTLGISLLTGIIFGLAPAVHVSRTDLSESLKEGSRGSTGGRRSHFIRSALIVAEVALSLMLLVGAGLLIRSFVFLLSEDIGFDTSYLLTMQVWLPETQYALGPPVVNFYQRLVDRAAALPGVKSASAVNNLPLTGWVGYCDFAIAGRAQPRSGEQFTSQYQVVDWRYLRTMRIPLKAGRDFESFDRPTTEAVAVINETLARRYWPNEDPVGKQIRLNFPATRTPYEPQPSDSWLTIIGVSGDIQDRAWSDSKVAQLYLLEVQNPSRIMRLVMRSNGNPDALATAARRAVQSIDPDLPVTEVHTMDDLLAATMAQKRLSMLLLAVFAGIATLLAAVGIYGVMAYAVSQRARDIGIRMALGARPSHVLQVIVGEGMRLTGIGLAIGVAGSLVAMRVLQSQLYGVKPSDPMIFTAMALALALVAVAACYFPARRATKVDPLVALRYE